ncbi:putative ABC transport system permease protein [Thermomonospora echinospora]|uniref:Putative ABC transport system permease protein n=1 Tax=Thermomonospora echinospora TaxID=1992 RepID=A0A1H6E8X6_9ACTN|nr:ABC transporter permease [Thermomonospora echinospora]SEG93305.1 putative ABC transport system permease protein [Thermomonospora echinospora]
MRLPRPNGLARASVRARPASFAGTFVALLFASIVVTACGTLLQNGVTAELPPTRYAAAPVVVTVDQHATMTVRYGPETEQVSEPLPGTAPVPAALAPRIAERPGVAAAVPDQAFPVQAGTVPLTGRPWSAVQVTSYGRDPLAGGRAPADGEVALDAATARTARLGLGGVVTLTTAQGTRDYRLVGLTGEQATVWFSDADAAALSGRPGQADAIAVFPEPGVPADRLAREVRTAVGDGAKVHTGNDRSLIEHPELADAKEVLSGLGGSFGGITTLVAVFVVLGTVALAIAQRGREIAMLRAVGATPRQIRRTVAAESMIVAPLAGAAGALPGIALASWWFGELRDRGALPEDLRMSVGWIPVLTSVAALLAASLAGGWLAARRPAKARPSRAMGEAAVERTRPGIIRTALGLAALGGGVVLARVAATAAGEQAAESALGVVGLFMCAVALLGPGIAWLSALVLGVVLRAAGAPGRLAAYNSLAGSRRLASAITPIVLTVAFTGTLLFVQSTLAHATLSQARRGVVADHVLTAPGAGLSADASERAARLRGVDVAVGVLRSGVLIRTGDYMTEASAIGLSGQATAWPKVLDLGMVKGDLAALSAGGTTVALDHLVAESADATVGSRIDLWLADGTKIRPTVVALYRHGLGLGQVVLPRETLAGHVTSAFDAQVLVRNAPGARQETVRDALRREVGVPGLTVTDKAGFAAQTDENMELNAWVNLVMAAVLGGFAAIAAANTLVMTILDRNREIALLRLAGATRRQVRAMVRWEALLVTATGLLIGGAILTITLIPFARGITGGTPHIPLSTTLTIATAVSALCLLSTALPARMLLRTPPAPTASRS